MTGRRLVQVQDELVLSGVFGLPGQGRRAGRRHARSRALRERVAEGERIDCSRPRVVERPSGRAG